MDVAWHLGCLGANLEPTWSHFQSFRAACGVGPLMPFPGMLPCLPSGSFYICSGRRRGSQGFARKRLRPVSRPRELQERHILGPILPRVWSQNGPTAPSDGTCGVSELPRMAANRAAGTHLGILNGPSRGTPSIRSHMAFHPVCRVLW